jgi:hypothetical protein
MDPIGFAFEHFDAVGAYRETDKGQVIDTTGMLDGVAFDGLPGLAAQLSNSERSAPCLVEHLYDYALGAVVTPSREASVEALDATLAGSGGRLRPLLVDVVMTDGFRHVADLSALRRAEGEL